MLQFPEFLEGLILSHLKKTYLKSNSSGRNSGFNEKDARFFSKGAARLSEAFTSERASLPSNYFNDPVLCSGYLVYFLPVNFLKIVRVMREIPADDLMNGQIRILDIGSGPGTNMLGMMHFFESQLESGKLKNISLDFTLIDQNFSILKTALLFHDAYRDHLQKRFPGFKSTCTIKNYDLRRGGVHRFLGSYKFHYITMSNVLNEFSDRGAQIKMVSELWNENLDAAKGKMVLIEPATKRVSRDLQAVRDAMVVETKKAYVLSPCLHQEICPLNLFNKRDWCHFYFTWKRPAFIERIDRLIGNKKDFLATAHLLLSKNPPKRLNAEPDQWRVISNVLPSRGKKEMILCGPLGRYHVTRLDRHRSATNHGFDGVQRGNRIRLKVKPAKPEFQVDGKYEIQEQDSVEVKERL